jgi:hypothetical protein
LKSLLLEKNQVKQFKDVFCRQEFVREGSTSWQESPMRKLADTESCGLDVYNVINAELRK